MNIEEQYNGFSVYKGTRSKSQNSDNLQVLDQKRKVVLWVSATKTYNALTSNHLVDWLNLYGTDMLESDDPASTQFMQFLFKRGHQFEKMIVNNILAKMDGSCNMVCTTGKSTKSNIWNCRLANPI
jgi:hypothetical protein